ncbi:GNAT family N-acetyltransferase [Streptomyces katsurahamanus]|uniref:GNAT family N-acetyltransferase n=1 Tax=Streptomyces katsurahamanus TaxID=2577098 RepID=A0ABW9NNX0_9ACTN|nr:GNAT family N-acetyltransferase [Streptomyces katsurahamanus]MQS34988.1 GNAT family N-acetyltransferase [Streptomyces katsurahamanus]
MGAAIRRAAGTDRETVAELLDRAFRDDPVSAWVLSGGQRRHEAHRPLMEAFLDIVLAAGRVDLMADGSAAALWLSVPDGGPRDDDGSVGRLVTAVDPGNERIGILGRLTGEAHPKRAHEYLWFIAVDPARQGEGLGTELLRTALAHGDREGVPAYLEASSSRSRDLYRRLGFTVVEPLITLPDGPVIWPMWREPRP